jgi:hypothetical protein
LSPAEHQEQRAVIERLRRDAGFLAGRFRLQLRAIDAEGPRVKRRYGICYEDGSIRIRLRHVRSGQLLRYSALIDTLCHELAHLRHFNHGPNFHMLYRHILAYARRSGIYRPSQRPVPPREPLVPEHRAVTPASSPPRPPPPRGPIQLELFR